MAEVMELKVINNVVHNRCVKWIERQKDCLYIEDITAKRKPSLLDYDDCYNTDSEFDSVSVCDAKRRRVGTQLKDEILDLTCEWKECTFKQRSKHMEEFLRHVSSHIPGIQVSMKDDNEVYVCQWKDCLYDTEVSEEVVRHVNYHAYHTKLKSIGSNVREKIKLPVSNKMCESCFKLLIASIRPRRITIVPCSFLMQKCRRDPDWKNIIETPSAHLCRWEECLKVFTNYQMYLYHVTIHTEACPRGNRVQNGIECKWTGCSGKYPSLYKLRDHMRCHTKEKIVACPDCGAMFASKTKFHIHCQRQIPLEGINELITRLDSLLYFCLSNLDGAQ